MGKRGGPKAQPAPKAAKVKKTAAGAQASTGALAATAAGAPEHLQATSQVVSQNSSVLSKHQANVALVHADFGPDFEQQDPPTKSWLRSFDEAVAVADLKKHGKHTCLINAAWLDHSYSPCPSIPLVWRTVENMLDHYFRMPNNLSEQKLEVVVFSSDLVYNRLPTKGSWKFISAEEPVMAMYAAIATAVQARRDGEGEKTQEELQRMDDTLCVWKEKLLETQVDIRVVETDVQLQWEAQQYRENINQRQYLARTPVQRIFDLQSKSMQLGPHSSDADLAALYRENLRLSSKSEPISDHFIAQGLEVYRKAFAFPEILEVVMQEEEYHTESLFNGVSKLHAVVNKASTREETFWVISLLHHCRLTGEIKDNSVTSTRSLQGTQREHNQGLVDVMLYQHRVKSYLLSEFLPVICKQLTDDVRAKIRSACADCQAYRSHVGVGQAQDAVSLGWKSGWTAAADGVLVFFGDAIFSMKYHESMRASLRQAKSVEDCLDSESKLGEACKEVKDLLEQERLALAESNPAAAGGSAVPSAEQLVQESLETQSAAVQDFVKSRGIQSLDGEKIKALQVFERKARMLVQSNVALHVFADKEKELVTKIKDSPAGAVRGKDTTWVGIFVDPAHIGEPATAAHARVAPCNQKYLKNILSSVLKTRDPQQTSLHPRDMFFLFDSGVHTHQQKMLQCIMNDEGHPMPAHHTKVYIAYDENALRERRKTQRASLDQVEHLTIVTGEEFTSSMVQRPRRSFAGSNFGNVIGPVRLDAPGELWQLSVEEKLVIYGKYRMPVGGRPEIFYQEMVASYNLTALIDCQVADGVLASLAAVERLPYIGFCLTETHLQKVKEVIVCRVLKEMVRPNSKVNESKLVEILADAPASSTQAGGSAAPVAGADGGSGSSGAAQSVLDQFQAKLKALQGASG
ncbi:unnamed protein product [Symbiodinium sp. CCMP2456]|nr:unnamed protein product [Symbiodinium sp. CCMP2456]